MIPHFQPKSKAHLALLILVVAGMGYSVWHFRGCATPRPAAGTPDRIVALRAQKKVPEAIAAAEKKVAAIERERGTESEYLLPLLDAIAEMRFELKQWAEGDAAAVRSLAIREKHFGPQSKAVVVSLGQRATSLLAQGRPADAEPLCERAIRIGSRASGLLPKELSDVYLALGTIQSDAQKWPEAEAALRRALSLREAQPGDVRFVVLPVVEKLAVVYRKTGKKAEAEAAEERVKAIQAAQEAIKEVESAPKPK